MANTIEQHPSVVDDLICPITFELPLDPVTAEDGIVYERSAIEEYFQSKEGHAVIKSPVTQQVIGKKLLPAIKHKNTIESLIAMGVIAGSLATNWKEKEEGEEIRKGAEAGDATSMYELARCYYDGKCGFTKNLESAFLWVQRAHSKGHVHSTVLMAWMLLHGEGVAKNETEGIMYLSMAAGKGSALDGTRKRQSTGSSWLPVVVANTRSWTRRK
jgi:U-box domain/Sel1 repeat